MIFVDTWAWLALACLNDPYHGIALAQHRLFQKQQRAYVTTDFVIAEFISALFGAVSFPKARQFVQRMFYSFQISKDQLIFVSPTQFHRAWGLRQQYHDKPDISFVDLTSMVVMLDLGLTDIFTGDQHFLQVNLGFRLFP